MSPTNFEFPLLVLDDNKVLQFLYSAAYARAALADLEIITERNVFNIVGPIGNAQRVGSRNPGNPGAVTSLALTYYSRYVDGFCNRQTQGPGPTEQFLKSIAVSREKFRSQIQKVHDSVNKHNSSVVDFYESAAKVANTTRALGTVVMATGATVAAVTGSAAAAPTALIYLGYKIVNGMSPVLFEKA